MGLIDNLKNLSSIKEGDVLKNAARLKENDPENATISLTGHSGKILVCGAPGAFTPPCSDQVPGFVQHFEAFKAKGIQAIYIVTVNDVFVVKAWKEKLGATSSPVHFLADDTGSFTAGIGMLFDASGLLGGKRSKRYSLLLEDGVVKKVWVEDEAPNVDKTKAENILAAL